MKFLNILFIFQNIIYLNILNTLADASAIPDSIIRCHFSDLVCLKKSIEHVFQTHSKTGVPELNILPIDPLRVNALKMDKNPTSPVSVELQFKDIDILGLSTAKIYKISGFDADFKDLIEVQVSVPKIEIKGQYSVNGSVLVLPISGKGKSHIEFEDILITAVLHPETYIKEGHTYMKVTSSKLDLAPKHASFYFENLFNGDKMLSDNVNKFLNENWSYIFDELKPDLSVAISAVIVHIINQPFAKFSYESLFLK